MCIDRDIIILTLSGILMAIGVVGIIRDKIINKNKQEKIKEINSWMWGPQKRK